MIKFRLARTLRKKDISMSAFSKDLKMRPATVLAYCHGYVKRINVKDLNKMCNKLECGLEGIIEYVPDKKKEPNL